MQKQNKKIKHLVLAFINEKEVIDYKDIIKDFNHSKSGAISYLLFLEKQNLVKKDCFGRYKLSQKGEIRLAYLDKKGCNSKKCLRCEEIKNDIWPCF
ncbi:MAG: hypothetical protein K9L87_01355 [Candidatus Omnitrophica bacterium]|nr:hypothetical protein [Candidatus Omnitrophota bacterium]MCF7909502.1 hypothetical protein [Candidatus Omnitrophota bacterium]